MASPLLDPPEPAPSRGQYDRALSRLERQQRQRERLLFFAAREYHARGADLTVAHVVAAASTGRNTFYEYFDDLDNALDASGKWVVSRLEGVFGQSLEQARTPIARLKILSASWFEGVHTDPSSFAVLVRRPSGVNHETLTEAVQLFSRLLAHAVGEESLRRRSGSTPHLDLAVAHAMAGLTAWSLAGGAAARELEPAARAILLDVFR
jgi:AcrR family transcriptional regulator